MAVPLAAESVTKALDECVFESPITGNASKWVFVSIDIHPSSNLRQARTVSNHKDDIGWCFLTKSEVSAKYREK